MEEQCNIKKKLSYCRGTGERTFSWKLSTVNYCTTVRKNTWKHLQ